MRGRLIIMLVMAFLALPFVLAYCARPATAEGHAVYLATLSRPWPPIRVVWVGGQGSDRYRAEVARGLAYWRELAGVPLPTVWTEEVVRLPDPFADWHWLQALDDPAWLTIAVVVNPAGQQVQLGGGVSSYGYNIPSGNAMFCATHGDLISGAGLGLCVAHELGHWLGLPEGSSERDGRPASIMRDLVAAWERWEMHPLDREAVDG